MKHTKKRMAFILSCFYSCMIITMNKSPYVAIELQTLGTQTHHHQSKTFNLTVLANQLNAWLEEEYRMECLMPMIMVKNDKESTLSILQAIDDKISTTKTKPQRAQKVFKIVCSKNDFLARTMTKVIDDTVNKIVINNECINLDFPYTILNELPLSSKKYAVDGVFTILYKDKDLKEYTHIAPNNNGEKLLITNLVTAAINNIDQVDGNTLDNILCPDLPHPNELINSLPFIIKMHIMQQAINLFYKDEKLAKQTYPLKGHTEKINFTRLSPSNTQIASCADDRTVRLWDIKTGDCSHTLKHDNPVTSCSYNTSGAKLAAATGDSAVSIWTTDNGTKKEVIYFPTAIYYVTWEKNFLVGGDGKQYIYIKDMTKKTDDISSKMFFPHENQSLVNFKEYTKTYLILPDDKNVLLTITNAYAHLTQKACKNSGNDSKALKKLIASQVVGKLSALEKTTVQQGIKDKGPAQVTTSLL